MRCTQDGMNHAKIGANLKPVIEKYYEKYETDFNTALNPPKFTNIFIPILRGLRPIASTNYEDWYKAKIIQDYFGKQPSFIIFTGLSAYDDIRNHLLGNLTQRKLIKDYEEYLSSSFFDNKEVTLIPSVDTEHLNIKIGNEKEQPIFELGDGIQSIIIVTLPLFLHRGENVLLFIDEPEKLMHPGLQRKLVNTLLCQEGFENFQYFITTHSNHLLDITLDYKNISIFSFHKELNENDGDENIPKFIIQNLSAGDHNALELLGVRNSSVFLSNCTIWVEGITDRKYLRKYLEMYLISIDEIEKYREDFHYSFVEYGGNNIAHWSFLDSEENPINVDRLCGKIFLIADRDGGDKPRHEILKECLNDRFCELPCREIENLLSKDVLLKVIKQYEKCEPSIRKFKEEDYKYEYLGSFIDGILVERKRPSSYCKRTKEGEVEGSGTIKDKPTFCEKALNSIETWDDLSDDAQEVTERIYKFIKKQNSD